MKPVKNEKNCSTETNNKLSNNCWSRLNASRAACSSPLN